MKDANTYRVGKLMANEYPVVQGTRCVSVQIPDDISFLPVLAAMVAALGNTWSTLGTREERQAWAKMWQDAYAATDWSGCMDCEQLQDCIGPLLAEQTQIILDRVDDITRWGTDTTGTPFTIEQINENLAGDTNATCDLDILWSQCLALVQFTNRQMTDLLEKLESATNVVELAGLSDDIPVIGVILKTLGVELATNAMNYFQ